MNPSPLIECVPNFSEGRDPAVIDRIVGAIRAVSDVRVLHVDMGPDANRTVVTLAGPPQAVTEAAYVGIAQAVQLIDLNRHRGAHPRMGAVDVCPFVPLRGIGMEAVAELARALGARVAAELDLPVYLYEESAATPERANLATIRAGGYEGLEAKMLNPAWAPDFGPAQPHPSAGAVAIGARHFLLAFNVNLNTSSAFLARKVAEDVREIGRIVRHEGKLQLDEHGIPLRRPGDCKFVKAIGWYQESFGIAQVSMNLTRPHLTPLQEAFEACRRRARQRGLRVTGSELVGMTPLCFLTAAGRYYLRQQQAPETEDVAALLHMATRSLGLNDIRPFDPEKQVIEYRLEEAG